MKKRSSYGLSHEEGNDHSQTQDSRVNLRKTSDFQALATLESSHNSSAGF